MYKEIDNDVLVSVTNRNNSIVTYVVPELGVRRSFAKGETKKIKASELRSLSWVPGGKAMLKHCLILDNTDLVQELLGAVEPEYYYNEAEVEELLLYGSDDQLRDALEFGYEGTRDLIKHKAVNMKLNDVRKRNIIFEMTGFNVSNAISVNEQSNVVPEEAKTRRANPIGAAAQTEDSSATPDAPVRRVAAPKYKVTSTVK